MDLVKPNYEIYALMVARFAPPMPRRGAAGVPLRDGGVPRDGPAVRGHHACSGSIPSRTSIGADEQFTASKCEHGKAKSRELICPEDAVETTRQALGSKGFAGERNVSD
jgi:hypothetical protein